jgi:hypothetical protein
VRFLGSSGDEIKLVINLIRSRQVQCKSLAYVAGDFNALNIADGNVP